MCRWGICRKVLISLLSLWLSSSILLVLGLLFLPFLIALLTFCCAHQTRITSSLSLSITVWWNCYVLQSHTCSVVHRNCCGIPEHRFTANNMRKREKPVRCETRSSWRSHTRKTENCTQVQQNCNSRKSKVSSRSSTTFFSLLRSVPWAPEHTTSWKCFHGQECEWETRQREAMHCNVEGKFEVSKRQLAVCGDWGWFLGQLRESISMWIAWNSLTEIIKHFFCLTKLSSAEWKPTNANYVMRMMNHFHLIVGRSSFNCFSSLVLQINYRDDSVNLFEETPKKIYTFFKLPSHFSFFIRFRYVNNPPPWCWRILSSARWYFFSFTVRSFVVCTMMAQRSRTGLHFTLLTFFSSFSFSTASSWAKNWLSEAVKNSHISFSSLVFMSTSRKNEIFDTLRMCELLSDISILFVDLWWLIRMMNWTEMSQIWKIIK